MSLGEVACNSTTKSKTSRVNRMPAKIAQNVGDRHEYGQR